MHTCKNIKRISFQNPKINSASIEIRYLPNIKYLNYAKYLQYLVLSISLLYQELMTWACIIRDLSPISLISLRFYQTWKNIDAVQVQRREFLKRAFCTLFLFSGRRREREREMPSLYAWSGWPYNLFTFIIYIIPHPTTIWPMTDLIPELLLSPCIPVVGCHCAAFARYLHQKKKNRN